MQNDLEIALTKYNKKTWCKSAFLGFFIGLAVIVPGISGSTIAIIFKLYDQFLYAIGNLFKKFKACFAFLLPIGVGVLVGVLLGFVAVEKLLELLPFSIVCLFAGLMCGSFPAIKEEVNGVDWNKKRIALFALGVAIPVALGATSALLSTGADADLSKNIFVSVQWHHVALAVVVGTVVGVTQIVPGLSASAFLMAIGWYTSLMSGIKNWQENLPILLVLIGLGVGFLIGVFAFSKLLNYVFATARQTAYSMIVGLSLGSILSMFCNRDIALVYTDWALNGIAWLDVLLGVALFALGVICAYWLVKYQRKKEGEIVA